MSFRASKHKFTGETTSIDSYDSSKTNLGSLMVQQTGTNPQDKFVGPLPVGLARPMQEVVHTGNVDTVSSTVVTGNGTSFTSSMTGMVIGFGSIDPAKVTTWYTLGAWTSSTVIAITSGPTIGSTTPFVIVSNIPAMYPHVITYSSTIDWVFMIENLATASAARRILFYEYNKTNSTYTWKGFINSTLLNGSYANTIRGFRALRYLHTTGTASVSTATVTGVNTTWSTDRIAIGARIGFGSTDPAQISTWYYINAINSDTSITIQTNTTASGTGGTPANITISPAVSYVIEELRFALVTTQATEIINGGLFIVKGINYADFTLTGTIISAGAFTDNQKAVYKISDAGNTGGIFWTTNNNSSGSANWYSIASSSDGTKLVAAPGSGGGYIITSTNSGLTWSSVNNSGSRTWQSVASSSDGTKLAAVVATGYIYTSTDSGVTWTTNSGSSGSKAWLSIASSADGTKLAAVVQNEYIYTSSNSGLTWTNNSNSSGSRFWRSIASSADGTKLAAVDSSPGYIYTSSDSGLTWTTNSNSSGSRNWLSIASSSDGTRLVAANNGGYIYTSSDSGLTWTTNSNSSGSRSWTSVTSSADGSKIAAGDNTPGYIYISTDFGVTWTSQTGAGSRTWRSMAYSADGTKLIVGDNTPGYIWTSNSTGVPTNVSSCGLAIASETNKSLHYAYVPDGLGSSYMKVYRYNLRALGNSVSDGKLLVSISYTTSGTVTVSSGVVTASGTPFNASMVGMKIGFGSSSPALITTWYTIGTYTSTSSVTLTNLTVNVGAGSSYIVDSADVLCTGNELVAGGVVAVNNGRIGTLNHGPGAGVESLYFVTTTRIYRAALSNIYANNLDWISDNRPEIPPGSSTSFGLTNGLNAVEIADQIDRLIILTTGSATRNYVTRYPNTAGDSFDHIWGVDDKQQDQILAGGNAYISSGTVSVSNTSVTGVNTFFTTAMIGFRIGFGTTDPTAVSTWYTIATCTSFTAITLSSSAGSIGLGSSYVIDWNSNTFPHFNSCSAVTSVWSQNGIAHIIKHGTTSSLNQIYSLPLSAHWTYAKTTKQRVITPAIYTPDCVKFQRVIVTDDDRFGGGEFSVSAEPFRLYYRMEGIDGNTGEWTLALKNGDLSGIVGSPRIQFMFEFSTIGLMCVPARIMGLTVIYDDSVAVTDSHYQPSVAKSNATSKRFAWRFANAFNGTVPTLRVRIYNAITGDLLIDDYTTNSKGTWNKLTDGGSVWGAYNTSDKTNETTYISYTPASLGDNIKVRIVLTQ